MGQKVSLGRKADQHGNYSRLSGGGNKPEPPVQPTKVEAGKLVFPEDCDYKFDLTGLLRALAEVLGKGSFGTSYKASLEDGTIVAVKRLKLGHPAPAATEPEVKKLMETISRIRHENVATVRAYYTDKDEQILIYDYYDRRSMLSFLQGDAGFVMDRPWEIPVNMAIGVARGLAYIHSQDGGKLVHGNLKPSNIFLNSKGYGIVSNILFPSLKDRVQRQPIMKYQAPEVVGNVQSQESDVYSFGVLLLELLVRKFEPSTSDGEVHDFVRWGQIVSREVETGELFVSPLMDRASVLKELQVAFHIAIHCVQNLPDERPKMSDVSKRLEGIRECRSVA